MEKVEHIVLEAEKSERIDKVISNIQIRLVADTSSTMD